MFAHIQSHGSHFARIHNRRQLPLSGLVAANNCVASCRAPAAQHGGRRARHGRGHAGCSRARVTPSDGRLFCKWRRKLVCMMAASGDGVSCAAARQIGRWTRLHTDDAIERRSPAPCTIGRAAADGIGGGARWRPRLAAAAVCRSSGGANSCQPSAE